MFSLTHNRKSNGKFAHKDRAPLTKAERAEKRAAMAQMQARLKAEQIARHAAFNESMKAVLAAKEVSR
jgi:hypothetical protein